METSKTIDEASRLYESLINYSNIGEEELFFSTQQKLEDFLVKNEITLSDIMSSPKELEEYKTALYIHIIEKCFQAKTLVRYSWQQFWENYLQAETIAQRQKISLSQIGYDDKKLEQLFLASL